MGSKRKVRTRGLAAALLLTSLPASGQYVSDYIVLQLQAYSLWHCEVCAADGCWESGAEEYGAHIWAAVNRGPWHGGSCFTCQVNGDCQYYFEYYPLGQDYFTRRPAEIEVMFDAWEDDGGDRCESDIGDDCRWQGSDSVNFQLLPPEMWHQFSVDSVNHRVFY